MTLSLIRVVIVEDQPNLREEIQLLVERQIGFAVAGCCGTVKEARQLIHQTKPDLLLLDIQLPDGTGFDILQDLPQEFKLIILTAYEKHAIQAIKHGALDYLLKPVNEAEFSAALHKAAQFFPVRSEQLNVARQYQQQEVRNKLVLRNLDYVQVVDIDQILYCQSGSGYTSFFLSDGRKVMVTKILKDYEDILVEPAFLRLHQSYLVNTRFIDKYSKEGLIYLKNGEKIPVAVRQRPAVMEFFKKLK